MPKVWMERMDDGGGKCFDRHCLSEMQRTEGRKETEVKQITHGTCYGYTRGCRCRACTDANNAHSWAKRKVERWDSRIVDAIGGTLGSGSSPVVFLDRDITITHTELFEALRDVEREIKMGALVRFWHKHIKKEQS